MAALKHSNLADPTPVNPVIPIRAPSKIWIVRRENGEHFFLEREPLEGIQNWAKGQKVKILEYTFHKLVY